MGYWRAESIRESAQVYFCSECGKRVHMAVSRQKHQRPVVCVYPYCPWCKATMDGGIVKPVWNPIDRRKTDDPGIHHKNQRK